MEVIARNLQEKQLSFIILYTEKIHLVAVLLAVENILAITLCTINKRIVSTVSAEALGWTSESAEDSPKPVLGAMRYFCNALHNNNNNNILLLQQKVM